LSSYITIQVSATDSGLEE